MKDLPDGEEWYAFNASSQMTTTDLTPQEIHDIGLVRGQAHSRT